MRVAVSGLLALSFFLSAWPAHAVTVSKTYSYFTVGGSTIAEIEAELARRGPILAGSSGGHPGATRMEFTTEVSYRERGSRCRVEDARIALKVEVILPRWRPGGGASPETRMMWSVLAADIRRHEESHVTIARSHAREMKQSLVDLGSFRNCTEAERWARQTSDRILAAHERAQARFDRVEGINFERRLESLLRYRMEGAETR